MESCRVDVGREADEPGDGDAVEAEVLGGDEGGHCRGWWWCWVGDW